MEHGLETQALSSTPTVSTDKADYAPGETVEITASGFQKGATIAFTLADAPTDPGRDGDTDAYGTFFVTDGGAGDLDHKRNGTVVTNWTVPTTDSEGGSYPDALDATLNLTAQAVTPGKDGQLGTADDVAAGPAASTTFTDAGPIITPVVNVNVTHDETAGLQNATATLTPAGDADDNDTDLPLPSPFSTRLTALSAGTAIGSALSGYTGATGNTGSNIFTITPAPNGTITDIAFTDGLGAALSGLDSGLKTTSGNSIFLYTDGDNNNIVLGRAGTGTIADPNGTIVFAAYIEETGTPVTGGKIWTTQYLAIKHPDITNADDAVNLLEKLYIGTNQDLEFSLANAPSGQNLFLMFTTATPTIVDGRIGDPTIIATGRDPANQSTGVNITTGDTINSSQAGGPTTFGTNNQMIVEGEGLRFSFVTGANTNYTIPNLDQNEADVEANIDFTSMFNARRADFDVVQLQSGKSAVVKVTAYTTASEPGVNFIDGYGNDTEVNINSIRVSFSVISKKTTTAYSYIFNEGGTVEQVVGPPTPVSNFGLSASFTGNTVTISGVQANYNIQYSTSSDHNRVLVENAGIGSGQNSADFDIGGFSLLQVATATAEIGSKIRFEDDGPGTPTVTISGTDPSPSPSTADSPAATSSVPNWRVTPMPPPPSPPSISPMPSPLATSATTAPTGPAPAPSPMPSSSTVPTPRAPHPA